MLVSLMHALLPGVLLPAARSRRYALLSKVFSMFAAGRFEYAWRRVL